MPARYISMQDAAERCDVSVKTVRNWIAWGRIHGYRLPAGKTVRVDPEEIEALIEPIPTATARSTR